MAGERRDDYCVCNRHTLSGALSPARPTWAEAFKPMNDYSVRVRVEGLARGSGTQPYLEFPAAQCVCTWSWGLQPATALIDWVTMSQQPALLPLSLLTIELRYDPTGDVLHTFYGICKQVAPTCQECIGLAGRSGWFRRN